MKKYILSGYVYGRYWGGGEGAYPCTIIKGSTKKEVEKKAVEMLKTGALDSGMGYESLIGAILDIKEVITRKIKGVEYTREVYYTNFIGDLTDSQKDFLQDLY